VFVISSDPLTEGRLVATALRDDPLQAELTGMMEHQQAVFLVQVLIKKDLLRSKPQIKACSGSSGTRQRSRFRCIRLGARARFADPRDVAGKFLAANSLQPQTAVTRLRSPVVLAMSPGAKKLDGLRLARVVRNRWPPVALIVTSGRRSTETELPPGGRFLDKPYEPAQIGAALRELIC
jgi:hypothetical protein